MYKIDYYYERLNQIAKEARETIIVLLNENNLQSVNFLPYGVEGYIERYFFFDVDKNGCGAALDLDSLAFKEGRVMLNFSENEGGYFGQTSLDNLPAHECVFALEMLTNVIEYSKEAKIPVLAEDQDFDDIEKD